MIPRERAFWTAQAVLLYVCAAVVRAEPATARGWLGVVLAPVVLYGGWRWASAPQFGADWIDATARRASQFVALGVVMALVPELAMASPGFVAARVLGLAIASTSAPLCISRIAALGGHATKLEHRGDAAIATAFLWSGAVGLAAFRALAGDAGVDALTVDYAVVAAALGSIGIAIVASWRVFAARRFELGVPERAAAALWLAVVCLALGTLASLMEVAPPERIVPISALFAAAAAAGCSISQNPALVARVLRLAASATMLATPLMSVAVLAAYKAPTHAGLIVFVATACAVGSGILAPRVAERMAPERGRWLRVLEHATLAAKAPDPRQAVVLALVAIRDGLGADEGPAALHRFATADRWTVDRAGYLHIEPGLVPLPLVERVALEPERIVCVEVLRALEVRQSEVRAWVSWLDERRAGAAALVLDDDIPVGMLLLPAAGRVTPLAFEEVCAFRKLADHLGVATGAEALLDRSRERALEVERDRGHAVHEVRELREQLARSANRHRASAAFLADRARVGAYGPAAQMALTVAERLGEQDEPLVVLQRPGGDALPWAAVAHLASSRQGSLLLVVDGSRREEHILERWTDGARSPLELGRGGTLVILDAQALPRHVQRLIGTSRRGDTGIIVALPAAASEMAARGELDPHLAVLFGERILTPPALEDRSEDLRALALHELARIGSRLRGKAFGLSLEALRRLGEHDWPGNEAELSSVVLRAALATEGDVVGDDAVSAAMNEPGERMLLDLDAGLHGTESGP